MIISLQRKRKPRIKLHHNTDVSVLWLIRYQFPSGKTMYMFTANIKWVLKDSDQFQGTPDVHEDVHLIAITDLITNTHQTGI